MAEQPEQIVMDIQKSYDRMIDAPTAVNTDLATAAAINSINVAAVCQSWIKLYGQFKGNGTGMSNHKFTCKFAHLIRTTFKDVTTINSDDILKEHKASSTTTIVNKDANQLIFDILSTICEDMAYKLISPYDKADDENANNRDGRRAYFALLREFFPKTTNSAGHAETKLRAFKFVMDVTKNVEQRTEFRKLIDDYGDARGHQLTRVEKYNAAIESISHKDFMGLRTIIDFHPEHALHDTEWLMRKTTSYIEMQDETEKPNNKGVAFGLTTAPTTLEDMLDKLNVSLAAITSAAQTAPRGPNKPRKTPSTTPKTNNKANRPPPYPCKYCPGEQLHWGSDCPRLAELQRNKEEKLKLAAVTEQTPPRRNFALGMQTAPSGGAGGAGGFGGGVVKRVASTLIGNPMLVLMSTLTGRVWINTMLIIFMILSIATSSMSTAGNILAAMMTKNSTVADLFKVDTGASRHVCSNRHFFKDFDEATALKFDVVHGESVCSVGSGTIDIIAEDIDGKLNTITLHDVHYIPGQSMNLISVSSALTKDGVCNPDFVNLTWKINNKTFEMISTDGTFSLNATPVDQSK